MPFSMLSSCYFLMLVLYLAGHVEFLFPYFLSSHSSDICCVASVFPAVSSTQLCQLCNQLSVVSCVSLAELLMRCVLAGVQ